ncbi:hypothetical protein TIFTF001_026034 [Ficus carica]|uniref:Uncharacterized protein n=1 Tax=Ficus carica TaxID=3494 RepID=A0AA88AKW1_FICCA|nr:hypothetical protein TIFTF001_026034 [Ficus carica]
MKAKVFLITSKGLLAQQAPPPLGDVVWPYWLAIPLENKGRLLSLKSNEDLMRCPPPQMMWSAMKTKDASACSTSHAYIT